MSGQDNKFGLQLLSQRVSTCIVGADSPLKYIMHVARTLSNKASLRFVLTIHYLQGCPKTVDKVRVAKSATAPLHPPNYQGGGGGEMLCMPLAAGDV